MAPHTPFVHCCEQQSASALHCIPSGAHAMAPHTPLLHCCEQQLAAALHGSPSGAHIPAPTQTPFKHCCEQHVTAALHGSPTGEHSRMPAQVPFVHCCEQHSASAPHCEPFGWHAAGAQTPLPQFFEQQFPLALHGVPSEAQRLLEPPPRLWTWVHPAAMSAMADSAKIFILLHLRGQARPRNH
jgi:hypothetical protein